LPYAVKDVINRRLQALEDYDGRVTDVDIALWRGAYAVDGIRIVKTEAEVEPFFSGQRVEFAVEWRSLLRGSLVATAAFTKPNLNLVGGADERLSQTGAGVNWPDLLDRLFPFRFNTVQVVDGTVTFRAPAIRTEDALTATNVEGEISNITNVADSEEEAFAGFDVTATVLDDGAAKVAGTVNPLANSPTFDVNVTVSNVQLPQVNPWLREYIKADAESGEFELYTEVAAADGKFKGYAKPIMRNVNIFSMEEEEPNPLRRLWEGIIEFAAEIFEDDPGDQVAARIPFSGTIEDPEAGIFETIVSVVRNAFVSSFARSLEGSISIRDVKENLSGIGEKPPEEEKEKETKGG
jgi:hypothetical protein